MRIVDTYSHLGGEEILSHRFPQINAEINQIIQSIDARRTKISNEKHKKNKRLFGPKTMNDDFKSAFMNRDFQEVRLDHTILTNNGEIHGYKQVDFSKGRVNVEVQFGKYAFMFYDMSKFQHFYNDDTIDVGVEIVPSHRLMKEMSSGVSYGEQLISDIERLHRHYPAVPLKIILIEPENWD